MQARAGGLWRDQAPQARAHARTVAKWPLYSGVHRASSVLAGAIAGWLNNSAYIENQRLTSRPASIPSVDTAAVITIPTPKNIRSC
jgi:hypothetical protein